jgi:uncharacterized protein YoxC
METIQTRIFELSESKARGGKRPIKFILHRIMDSPDDYQYNGISWKEEYVREAMKRISPAEIVVDYLDKGTSAEDTEIAGHGLVGQGVDYDGRPMPLFSSTSEVVGSITGAEIATVDIDGTPTKVLMADGVLYEHRCPGLVDYLKLHVPEGNVMGSVEIVGTPENDNMIVYEDGYKEHGRVPMQYEYSGYAILSGAIPPADDACHVLEINNKEDGSMDETKLRGFVDEIKTELHAVLDDKANLTNEVNSLNENITAKEAELNEANEKVTSLEAEVNQLKEDASAKDAKIAELEAKIGEYEKKARVAELESALSEYTESEQAYAKDEIAAFKADPMNCEINTVVNKICVGIVSERKHNANNEPHDELDIFGAVDDGNKSEISIF